MFVNLENGLSIKDKEIIGIFDMDTATVSEVTKDFLKSESEGMRIVYAGKDVPSSFVVTDNGISESVYMSGFTVKTILNRTKIRKIITE